MARTLEYLIESSCAGTTVDHYLRNLGYSKHVILQLKKNPGHILAGEKPVFTNYCLLPGETLRIRIPDDIPSQTIVPVPMALDIVYEDEDILVVNKAAGVPIHPSLGNFTNTLANGLAYYFSSRNIPFVYRATGRLDKDTSGLLVIAKHMLSACILSSMMAQRQIHREYLAVALGKVPMEGIIDAPIARAGDSIIQRKVDFHLGESARTHYRRISYHERLDVSLVSLRLETGRTHQIRVHMSYIGHPLPGDFLYCPDYSLINRQALHSHTLCFLHPITKKELHFEAPLPDDMKFVFQS